MPTPIDHPALDLFGELLAVPSPSGREERLAQVVRARLRAWGFEPDAPQYQWPPLCERLCQRWRLAANGWRQG